MAALVDYGHGDARGIRRRRYGYEKGAALCGSGTIEIYIKAIVRNRRQRKIRIIHVERTAHGFQCIAFESNIL